MLISVNDVIKEEKELEMRHELLSLFVQIQVSLTELSYRLNRVERLYFDAIKEEAPDTENGAITRGQKTLGEIGCFMVKYNITEN